MFKWLGSRVFWGVLITLVGVVLLLQNLEILEIGDLFWALLVGLAGVFFLSVFITNRANWWGLIPGFTLISLAILIFLDSFAPGISDAWDRPIVVGGIAASFLAVYLVDRSNWWAIIPGGVMVTVGLMAVFDSILTGIGTTGVFFIGMGLTFGLVALAPTPQGRMKWAWIPAGVLLVMGLIFIAAAEAMFGVIWSAALVVVGLFMIYRTLFARK